ncbi:hypothetical protein ALTERO38_51109 [Alteromonas sp. 38]|nr:hypothetical protein ALTER154_70290 [Alteromonas sp. 154]VXB60633.1 hypothetical protein ALTERO38_51109 [Alteromonas sp. 38]
MGAKPQLAAALIADMKLTPDSCFLPKANASLLLSFETSEYRLNIVKY